jgi:hypothetical protein
MYSVDEKQWKRKYSKYSAASVQNSDFYSKKWLFALLLLSNPLSYTIRHNISMGVVGIGCLLSLTLGQQRVIIMVISMILDDKNLKFQKSKITKSLPLFSIHHGKHHLSCCYKPCMPFTFIPTLVVYSSILVR